MSAHLSTSLAILSYPDLHSHVYATVPAGSAAAQYVVEASHKC